MSAGGGGTLIVSRVSLFPPEHGGAKNFRALAASLAREGRRCRVLVRLQPDGPARPRFAGQHPAALREFKRYFKDWDETARTWTHDGVEYRGVPGGGPALTAALREEIARLAPGAVVLCDDSLEDATELVETGAATGNLVFFAQTIHCLPFGPYSMRRAERLSAAIARARRIVVPSRHVRDYVQEQLGREAIVHYPDVFGPPPFPELGARDNAFITMINPCAWKGSSIFLKLAAARPDLAFAAVPTWGTGPAVLEALRALPNMTLLEETPRIDEIFARTRVLLAPSLCQEAFGLVSPEAMLRGIPVVASDLAGLKESTLGAARLIPVKPLPFESPPAGKDPASLVWNEPENPIEPWSEALDDLLKDGTAYHDVARQGREKALGFVRSLSFRPLPL